MKNKGLNPDGGNELRIMAEERLKRKGDSKEIQTTEDLITLVQELRIHQMELEIQNEELIRSGTENEELKNKYFELYDLAPLGYFTLDKKGKILDLNLTALKLFGKEKSLMIGYHFNDFIETSYLKDLTKFIDSAFNTKNKQTSVFQMRSNQNQIRYIQADGLPVGDHDGTYNKLWMTTADITKNILTEKALMESEEHYRSTLDNMLEGCRIIGFDWRFQFVNNAAAAQMKIPREELVGYTVMEIIPGIEETDLFANLKEAMEKHVPRRMEDNLVYPDGSESWFDLSIQPVPEGLFILSLDITKRKMAEKQKQEMDELKRAKETAEKADSAKSLFIANVSHELRTPLNAILGYSQILIKENMSERQKNSIEVIYTSGQHLLNLINDILDFSKIEAGKMTLEKKSFDLPDFLQKLAEIINIQAMEKNLCFQLEINSDLPVNVLGDETRLSQVLLNLLSNAVKFTEKGRVVLKVQRIMEGEMKSPGNEIKLRFEIKDSGIGIPDDKLDSVFDSFQQLNSKQLKSKGTGLGLTISRSLVELMGGELFVKSETGIGSTFWFDIHFEILSDKYAAVYFKGSVDIPEADSKEDFAVPSLEELKALYSFAKTGDIINLRKTIEKIEKESSELIPFSNKLKFLAKNIDLKEINLLLEKTIGDR